MSFLTSYPYNAFRCCAGQLGNDPIHPKNDTEPLFATEEEKPSAEAKAAKAAKTKLKNKKPFTSADAALHRALTNYTEDKNGIKDCLSLTSTEILMLTVLSSQGLPVYSDDWSSLLSNSIMMDDSDEDGDDEEFIIYFSAMVGVMQAAASIWLKIASKKLEQEIAKHSDLQGQVPVLQGLSEKDQSKIAVLQKDIDAKRMTLEEANAYENDPLQFAKKCIMLLEAVRMNMGPVDTSYAGDKKTRQLNKSENGLGTKV